jgi:uncharacterized protein (DUF849 family)
MLDLYCRKGQLAKSNAELVARTVRIARELNKEPALSPVPDYAMARQRIQEGNGKRP